MPVSFDGKNKVFNVYTKNFSLVFHLIGFIQNLTDLCHLDKRKITKLSHIFTHSTTIIILSL